MSRARWNLGQASCAAEGQLGPAPELGKQPLATDSRVKHLVCPVIVLEGRKEVVAMVLGDSPFQRLAGLPRHQSLLDPPQDRMRLEGSELRVEGEGRPDEGVVVSRWTRRHRASSGPITVTDVADMAARARQPTCRVLRLALAVQTSCLQLCYR